MNYLQSFAFLFLILFNIVRASFLSPSYSKYDELTVNGSEGEYRISSDEKESWDLASDYEDEDYAFISCNEGDSNNEEFSADDSRNINEKFTASFKPVSFFENEDSKETNNSVIKSDDSTISEVATMTSDDRIISIDEVSNGVQTKAIKPKRLKRKRTKNCLDCCNIC